MEPAAHDDGRLTIIEADTIQLLPAARRQLECLLDAAAIARITQLADPTMAWPEVLALTLGPKLVGLDVSILTWFHVATQLRRPQVFDVFGCLSPGSELCVLRHHMLTITRVCSG